MTIAQRTRIFIIDAAPGKALQDEISTFLKHRIFVKLNVNKFKNSSPFIHGAEKNLQYVDFKVEDRKALFDHIINEGIGFDVLQSRTNIAFNHEMIRLASSNALKHPLKIIAQAGVGISHIDCEAATEHGVIVTNTPGSNANAVAEFVIAQALALARNITFHNKESHLGTWSKDFPGLKYSELNRKTLGIVGIGNVAKKLIPKAQAFGMNIIGLSHKQLTKEDAKCLRIESATNLSEVLTRSDFVSLHVPLTPSTKNLIGAKELKLMKKGAFLINTSRGGIVNEMVLAEELKNPESNLAGAAIDTLENEKSVFSTPLIGLKNVLLTPHIAGTTPESLERSTMMISKNIMKILSGNFNVPIGNKAVLDKFTGPKINFSSLDS